ncbi:hypothetical protein [Burkholderia ubonensis]|uniref:hypothetical protein n=1 Tax=Burkholderia ubonensis TaxID=101571 RepID=UPI0018DF624B|nr:hypothetical protein [Burkholderia ubonensis]
MAAENEKKPLTHNVSGQENGSAFVARGLSIKDNGSARENFNPGESRPDALTDRIDDLRNAVELIDACRAEPDTASAAGSFKDALAWLEKSARALLTAPHVAQLARSLVPLGESEADGQRPHANQAAIGFSESDQVPRNREFPPSQTASICGISAASSIERPAAVMTELDAAGFATLQTYLTEHHADVRPSDPAGLTSWALAALVFERAASANETDANGADAPREFEQVIACLGDDAVTLRDADQFVEMADNMDAAARLLSACLPAIATDGVTTRANGIVNLTQHAFELVGAIERMPDSPERAAIAAQAKALRRDLVMATSQSLFGEDALARAPEAVAFQSRVQPWLLECFGAEIASDRAERNHRFLEEALELVQACGCTASDAHQLVDYTFSRPLGEPTQEIGGVMVTLAALSLANGLDMYSAAEAELARVWTKIEQIRAKQAAKPRHSLLPIMVASVQSDRAPVGRERLLALLAQVRDELSQVEWESDPPNRVVALFSEIDEALTAGSVEIAAAGAGARR